MSDSTTRPDHVMADTETLGTTPGSSILSIGAVAFDPHTGAFGEEFYVVVDRDTCRQVGLTEDAQTVDWWASQSAEAVAALEAPAVPVWVALARFCEFWSRTGARRIWGQGSDFDLPILSAAFRACGIAVPWEYNAGRDTRTVYELAGVQVLRGKGVHHHALDDARAQADAIVRGYAKLALPAALRGLLADAGLALPLTYRPDPFDDWGWIRGADGKIAAVAKVRGSEDELAEHRRNHTDPAEPVGRLIVEAVNALALSSSPAATPASETDYG